MDTMQQEARVPCPYCKEMILPGALKCKACGSSLRRQIAAPGNWTWARNLPDRKVLGVAACIATNFRVSATIVRLLFILLTFVSFLGLFIYLLLAAVIPAEQGQRSLFEMAVDSIGAAIDSLRARSTPAPAGSAPVPAPSPAPGPAPFTTPGPAPQAYAPPTPPPASPSPLYEPPPVAPQQGQQGQNPNPYQQY